MTVPLPGPVQQPEPSRQSKKDIDMFRKFILAGAMLTAFTAPTLAADWYVLKTNAVSEMQEDVCIVVDRKATPGEQEVSGPYASQTQAMAKAFMDQTCKGKNVN
jgi:hypothetical protein